MTTQKKADRRAEELHSGQGGTDTGTGNDAGTATGPGSMPAQDARHDNQRNIAGGGSTKAANGRPGHKNTD